MTSRFPSPLRYPGGKGKLANYIKLLFRENGLVGYDYIEPYAGGAAVALSLLFEEYASTIHINDLNASVFQFWSTVVSRPSELCRRVQDSVVTVEEWQKQKAVQIATQPDPLDLAFSTLFLNRTNRSGILGGGVIGGKNQKGKWKLDARFNKQDIVARIERIARFRNRIEVSNLDAAHFLSHHASQLPKRSFLYLDPPYIVKGAGLYENYYAGEDHAQIAALIQKEKRPWIVSYDDEPLAAELYATANHHRYSLSYSAGARGKGDEIIFFSKGLTIPKVKSPAGISSRIVSQARVV